MVRCGQHRPDWNSGWRQILPVATAGLAYGLATPLGGSGFIAAFVAGFAYGTFHRDTEGETTYLLDQLGGLANSVTFLVFGAAIAGTVLGGSRPGAPRLYGVLSLTAVRMLPVADLTRRHSCRLRTVAFVGWLVHAELASIVFTVIALEHGRSRTPRRSPSRSSLRSFSPSMHWALRPLTDATPLVPGPHRGSPALAWRACTRRLNAGAAPRSCPSSRQRRSQRRRRCRGAPHPLLAGCLVARTHRRSSVRRCLGHH